MTQNYKRTFGPQEANKNAPTALNVARCQQCRELNSTCARGVYLEYTSRGDRHLVCYKAQCVYCGAIQYWNAADKDGNPIVIPAFYVPHSQSRRPLTAHREFSLPEVLYKEDNRADVGLKVRIIDALLRLQLENPTEYIFTLKDVWEEMKHAA